VFVCQTIQDAQSISSPLPHSNILKLRSQSTRAPPRGPCPATAAAVPAVAALASAILATATIDRHHRPFAAAAHTASPFVAEPPPPLLHPQITSRHRHRQRLSPMTSSALLARHRQKAGAHLPKVTGW
jgi:hypothetical protein